MPDREPSFSYGIEEEYFLIDRRTRDLVPDLPPSLVRDFQCALGTRFSAEYMRAQIEVTTPVLTTPGEARRALTQLRCKVARLAAGHGLAPMAAGTHPFARWRQQRHTNAPRYNELASDLQALGRRMLVNGLHVHVGIEQRAMRIGVMNELRRFLPLLLALSTSSPFWEGEATGLKSYRTAVNDASPRKGIPERFSGWSDFTRAVGALVAAGVIEDASKVWWDVRPSARFPTLEVRISDVCPRVDDALSIAALVRCLCRYLYRARRAKAAPDRHPLLIINENRWRAERYGIEADLVDLSGGRLVGLRTALAEVLKCIREDARYFRCADEVDHTRAILERGTSAERQLASYRQCRSAGLSPADARIGVADQLIEETVGDGGAPPTRFKTTTSRLSGAHF